jgi:DNA-binding GntR family transcriptional regulator
MTEDAAALQMLQQRVADRRMMSLPKLIVDELEQLIVAGVLRAGDRINESAIAMRLGVSRGPVREACRQLERSRLVEFRLNRGMFVREISVHEAGQLYDVRAGLFGLAGRLAPTRLDTEAAEILRAKVRRLAEADGIDTYYPLNVEFHHHLVSLSGNSRLAELYADVSKELHLYRRHGLESEAVRRTSNEEHRRIVEHLVAGETEAAAKLMEAHIIAGKTRMLAHHATSND